MKKTIVVIAVLFFGLSAAAQEVKEADVPQVVREAFTTRHKEVKKVEWSKENGNFEAEFEREGIEQSIVFDPTGSLIETEVEIKPDALPEAAKRYIVQNYKAWKIKEAAQITDAQGAVTYEAEVANSDLIFDASGKFIKAETDGEDDKD